jgi:hypothetical protein
MSKLPWLAARETLHRDLKLEAILELIRYTWQVAAHAGSLLADFYILKMEAIRSS